MAPATSAENRAGESAVRAVLTTASVARVLVWLFAMATELGVWAATLWDRAARRSNEPSASTADATSFGPYVLGEKIGEGGMGVVYRAANAGRPTAIKLLPFDRAEGRNRERFEREFQ